MEKLSIEEFELHKRRVIDIITNIENNQETMSEEDAQQFIEEYESIMKSILDYDLSEIPASSWEGIYLAQTDNIFLDFSKTSANLDFSVFREIELEKRRPYRDGMVMANFKGCQISNFPFETAMYTPEMFDEEFIIANPDRFLSLNVPSDIRDRFYRGELTFADLQASQEVREKFLPDQLGYSIKEIYELIPSEEFFKLDPVFINKTNYWSRDRIKEKPDLKTAEEIMEYLYKTAREEMLSDEDIERGFYGTHLYVRPIELGEEFRKRNPDFYISEEAPSKVQTDFYSGYLSLETYTKNIEYFRNVNMSLAFGLNKSTHKYFGEDMYELFSRYGKYIYSGTNNYDYYLELPETRTGTIEEKRQVIANCLKKRLEREPIRSLDDIQVLAEILPIEDIVKDNKYASIISEAGIDKLKELGFTNMEDFKNGITKTETLLELSKVIPNLSLVLPKDFYFNSNYSIEDAVRDGIEDVSVFSQDFSQNIRGAKELIDKGVPVEILSFGTQSIPIKEFIRKYGIENLVKFDDETKIFSVPQRDNKNYQLEVLALQERNRPYYEKSAVPSTFDYETFRTKMYELLVRAREYRGILTSRDFPAYGHMEGKFREEHPEIFIDGTSETIANKFYFGILKPEDIQAEPEAAELLKGKDLKLAFNQEIKFPGLSGPNGTVAGFAVESFAKYVSEKYGEDKFFELCSKYGALICDKTNYFEKFEMPIEEFVETLEKNINSAIRGGLAYNEAVSQSFKDKYPDLFLPESVPEQIRKNFYEGRLTFENIRRYPELVTILKDKDIDVGFYQLKKNVWGVFQTGNASENHKYQEFFDKVEKEDILRLAEKYGKYLLAFKAQDLSEGYASFEELEEKVKNSIREGILSGKTKYSEDAPEFFKQEHPEFFLSEDAPELLKLSYYSDYKGKTEPYINHSSSNYAFKIKFLSEHPEFKSYLEGKKLDLITDKWAPNLATQFSTQEIIEMLEIDLEGVSLLSTNPKVVEKLRRNIDERPKDRENIVRYPGYTLYFSEDRRQEFDFAEYKELVTMSKFTVSDNYRKGTAEQILSTMYDFLGYAGSKEILRLPELEEDRIEEIIRSHGQAFSELYEEKFKLKGNLKVLNTLFDKFVPQLPGKKRFIKCI